MNDTNLPLRAGEPIEPQPFVPQDGGPCGVFPYPYLPPEWFARQPPRFHHPEEDFIHPDHNAVSKRQAMMISEYVNRFQAGPADFEHNYSLPVLDRDRFMRQMKWVIDSDCDRILSKKQGSESNTGEGWKPSTNSEPQYDIYGRSPCLASAGSYMNFTPGFHGIGTVGIGDRGVTNGPETNHTGSGFIGEASNDNVQNSQEPQSGYGVQRGTPGTSVGALVNDEDESMKSDDGAPDDHDGDDQVECEYCSKWFGSVSSRNRHVSRVHKGERPFICDKCGASFGQKSTMVRHQNAIHVPEKQFWCSECGKAFTRKDNLKTHLETVHMGHRPYKCHYCAQGFLTKKQRLKHMQDVHAYYSS